MNFLCVFLLLALSILSVHAAVQYRRLEHEFNRVIFEDQIHRFCAPYEYNFGHIESHLALQHAHLGLGDKIREKNFEEFAAAARLAVEKEVNRTVAGFCSRPTAFVSLEDRGLDAELNALFDRHGLQPRNVQALDIVRPFRLLLQTTAFLLNNLVSADAIIGFNEEEFRKLHPFSQIVNYTYTNVECTGPLQIKANACVVATYAENGFYPLFFKTVDHRRRLTAEDHRLPNSAIVSAGELVFLNESGCQRTAVLHSVFDDFGVPQEFDLKLDTKKRVPHRQSVLLCEREALSGHLELNAFADYFAEHFDLGHASWGAEDERRPSVDLVCHTNDSAVTIRTQRTLDLEKIQSTNHMWNDVMSVFHALAQDTRTTENLRVEAEQESKTKQESCEKDCGHLFAAAHPPADLPPPPHSRLTFFSLLFVLIASLLVNLVLLFKFLNCHLPDRFGGQFLQNAVTFVRFY
ncbi:hypothetical protein M3Y99_01627300 [Aphelenchoides fujianensis]|nr:hypothetical protein M3Y99_01627300 [Aphelenchoides fujianensis]